MKKFFEKIKNWLLTDEQDNEEAEDFATKRELWYFVGMCSGWMLTLLCGALVLLLMSISSDLTKRVQEQEEQIDYLTYESVRYKMMYEDLYDVYVYPQEYGYEGGYYEQ